MTAVPPGRLALPWALLVALPVAAAQEEPGLPGGATANQGRNSNAARAVNASQHEHGHR